jgi:hypothetical protein
MKLNLIQAKEWFGKATPGIWYESTRELDKGEAIRTTASPDWVVSADDKGILTYSDDDLRFICHAHNTIVPEAITEIEKLRELVKFLQNIRESAKQFTKCKDEATKAVLFELLVEDIELYDNKYNS